MSKVPWFRAFWPMPLMTPVQIANMLIAYKVHIAKEEREWQRRHEKKKKE